MYVWMLPRPQASLLARARCALGYGIDSCGTQGVVGSMQTKSRTASRSASEPSSLAPPVFSAIPPFTQQRLGTRLVCMYVLTFLFQMRRLFEGGAYSSKYGMSQHTLSPVSPLVLLVSIRNSGAH